MFYIQPKSEHAAAKWHDIARIERLPVYNPQPHRGLWHVNAAALQPWSLKAIAAYLARQSKTTRQSWVQATDQMMGQISEGFTVKADEWELIAPDTHVSGAFVWWGRGIYSLATHYPLFAYSNHHPSGEGATSLR